MGVLDLFFAIKARDETGAAFDKVRRNLRDVDGMTASVGERAERMGNRLIGFGGLVAGVFGGITLAFRDSLSLFDTQARAQAKVEQAVRQTGAAAGFTAAELGAMASALQDATRFGDEAILDGVTAQLLTFGNVQGEVFDRAQESILDLTTVLNGDLKGTAIMVGKALNDPIAGISALAEAGITFTEQQKEVVKGLAETGRVAEAQRLILDEIAKYYGGQARAAAEAGIGPLIQMQNAWGDMKEVVGGVVSSLLPPVVDFFQSIVAGFNALPEPVQRGAVVFIGMTAALGALAVAAGVATLALAPLTWPFLAIGAAIAGVTALVIAFWPEIQKVGQIAQEVFLRIKITVGEALQSTLESVVAWANGTVASFQGAYDAIKAVWGMLPAALGDLIYASANSVIGGVEAMINGVVTRINAFITTMNSALEMLPEWATGGEPVEIGLVGEVSLGRIENPYAGAAEQAGAAAGAAFSAAFQNEAFAVPDLGFQGWADQAKTDLLGAVVAGQVPLEYPTAAPSFDAVTTGLGEVAEAGDTAAGSLAGVGGSAGSAGAGLGGATKAARDARAEMVGLGEDAEETKGILDGFGQETAGMLKSMFADGKLSFEDFGSFILAWGDKLLDRLLTAVFDPLGDALQDLFDGLSGGGGPVLGGGGGGGGLGGLLQGVGSWIGGLLGFDTGGEMLVGGRAGIDRNVAAFRVTQGETIKVQKRGQPDGGGRPVVVNITTPDPAAFHASRGRIAADIQRAVGAGARFT
ncbi:tapemeasure [Rhodobacter phage RcCronus]|uniref:Tapemeasure n=1 Tax=Rhodobacter phage RcCronus TaxID=1662333 RepID=A0A0K1LLB8_9CAUD|nr:tail length tape measure protein [Rhodobacter phage RcCronus]AKU43302.1 tapemeasure [Rhodobacter phage RcCronus]